MVAEHRRHLFRGLQEELVAVVLQPLLVADVLACADTQQDVVRVLIGVLEVVHVVCRDQRKTQLARNRQQALVHDALFVDALILHLEEEILRAQDVAEARRSLERLAGLVRAQARRHLPLEAAAEPNQALGMLREQVLVDPRLVIEPFGVAGRHELHEVVKALGGLREQDEMIRRLAGRARLVAPISRRHIDLASEDGIDAPLPGLVVKGDRREHVAVFSDRHRRHLEFCGAVQHLADAAGAVEQRELRVQVQVDELSHPYSHSIVAGGLELMS